MPRLPVTALVDQFPRTYMGGNCWDTSSLIKRLDYRQASSTLRPGVLRVSCVTSLLSCVTGAGLGRCHACQIGLAQVFKNADNFADPGDTAGDRCRPGGLALRDQTHQVDHVALRDDL